MKNTLAVFEDFKIRRYYDEKTETWYFSVVNIIQVLLQQSNYQTARKYWNKLKERLKKEGNESVTNCHRLKLEAADGKKYLTDVANPETLLRLHVRGRPRDHQHSPCGYRVFVGSVHNLTLALISGILKHYKILAPAQKLGFR